MPSWLSSRQKSVARRVLLSYALVTLAFVLASGWGFIAQRKAAQVAHLMRSGDLPL